MIDPRSIEGLPERLAEIAGVIGIEGALLIARARGGARMKIPARVSPDSPLAQIVGMERAELLSAHYTSGHTSQEIEIPLGPTGARAEQVRAIWRLIEEGVSSEEIARRLRIASRTVRRHKARDAMRGRDKRQRELF